MTTIDPSEKGRNLKGYQSFPNERIELASTFVQPVIDPAGDIIGFSLPEVIPIELHYLELPPFTFINISDPPIISEGFFSHPNGIYPFIDLALSPNTERSQFSLNYALELGLDAVPVQYAGHIWSRLVLQNSKLKFISENISKEDYLKVAWAVYRYFSNYPYMSQYVQSLKTVFITNLDPRLQIQTDRPHVRTYPKFINERYAINPWLGLDEILEKMRLDTPDSTLNPNNVVIHYPQPDIR